MAFGLTGGRRYSVRKERRMAMYLVLAEAYADDVLSDWARYCRARGMVLGGFPGEGAHTVRLLSEDHRLRVTVERPEGSDACETLSCYLRDYTRRNPHIRITELPDEAAVIDRTKYEGTVGFIVG